MVAGMYVNVGTNVPQHACGDQDNLRYQSSPSTSSETRVSYLLLHTPS